MNNEMMNNKEEMKEKKNGMSVTSLLLKTLENATKEYARGCILKCAECYGFDKDEALRMVNLENLTLQVREMKKRSPAEVKKKEVKEVKEVKEKVVKEKERKIVLPFVASMVNSEGCGGLAYNSGLFTQCQKMRMSGSVYCKTCQQDAEMNASGAPSTGTVEGRLAVEMMEFRDSKGRKPVAYTKIMAKQGLSREMVDEYTGKRNILIDEVHFAIEQEKKKVEKVGRPKTEKKTKIVTAETVEDLFAQLVDDEEEDEESLAPTVLMSESEGEDEVNTEELEKVERNTMKDEDMEMKKLVQSEKKTAKKAEEKAAKEQKIAEEKAAKEQKIADELAAKEVKKQQLEAEKIAKAEKIAADKLAKEEKIAADKLAKEEKIAADKLAKEQKIANELAAKEAKKLELEAAKAAKEQKIADELAAKEAKKLELEAAKAAKAEKVVKEVKEVKKPVTKVATKVVTKVATKTVVAEEPKKEEAPKKVTVKRITIDGKQYLKTAENLLYDPETKEEKGIYDPETNTIKALPDDSEDEVSEDGYDSE